MTHEEVIKMAREAGLSITPPRSGQYDGGRVGCDVVGLKKFADLVAAHAQVKLFAPVQATQEQMKLEAA